jgi:hypothetical protein
VILTDQLGIWFESTDRKEVKDLVRDWEDFLRAGVIDEANLSALVAMLNTMKQRDIRPFPYFYSYLYAAKTIIQSDKGNSKYRAWSGAMQSVLERIENNRYEKLNELNKFSTEYFSSNKLVKSKAGASWYVTGQLPEYSFDHEGELLLSFEKVELSASRRSDSLVIIETTGSFRPEDKHWIAEGGKINWWRYGQMDVYCVLDSFEIDLKRPLFEVKKVSFHHPRLFPGQVLSGTLSEKVYSADEDGTGNYPKFDGEDKNVDLSRLIENVNINGAFSLHGTTIYSSEVNGQKAELFVGSNDGDKSFFAEAPRFKVEPDRVYTRSARMTLFIGQQDSIVHPAVSIDFKPNENIIEISEGEGLQAKSPFFNSYHAYSMTQGELFYDIKNDSIKIGKQRLGLSKINKEIEFQSPKFFTKGEYLRVQNIGRVNPLARLNQLADETGNRKFNLATVIDMINPELTEQSIQTLLADLVKMGFIEYNAANKEVLVKDKLLHYAESALDNTDYDNLKMISDTQGENGVLDLNSMEFLLKGVSAVSFSDSQQVAIKPYFDEITLLEDNKIKMHGKLFAGYTTFEGLNFFYDYDQQRIYLDSVREFQLYIPTGKILQDGRPEAVSVNSRIESMKGTLLIDAPHNKSGRFNIPIFPSIHSNGESYVYYDERFIQNGVYTRDSFYFELDEFDLESLDVLDSNEIQFSGQLVSKNIMQTFSDSLRLREDRSLGIYSPTPSGGYSLYQQKGKFTGQVDLSNKGFFGDGSIDYLKANINSEDILFKPYQLNASAEEFNLEGEQTAGSELPKVKGIDVNIDWRPYTDSMYITSAEAPFQMYEQGLHQFKGQLIYTPGGLKGNGELDWSKGAITSRLLSFGFDNAQADTLNLTIKAAKGDALAFDSRNQQGFLDFSKNYGQFEGNSDDANTYMPANAFKTNLNDFDWDMEGNEVIFKDPEGDKGIFIATKPEMDSLDFYGNQARYDLDDNTLYVNGVESMNAADALIIPVDGKVTVREEGVLDSLYDATILADTLNQYHEIKRATVSIKGKKEYTASGYYQYNIAGRNQEILFNNIIGQRIGKGSRSEKQTETRAGGVVKEDEEFYIDHKTKFRGSILLRANRQALRFKGFANFEMSGLRNDSTWFSVDFIGDKNDLVLTYDSPKTFEGYPVETGVFINKESAFVYPAVMSSLYSRQDRPLIDMSGVADYNLDKDQLIMGDSAIVLGKERRGNIMEFQAETGDVEARGELNICKETSLITIDAFGKVRTKDGSITYDSLGFAQSASETQMDVMAGLIFHIPDPLLKFMVKDLSSSLAGALGANYNDSYYDDVAINFIKKDEDVQRFDEQLLLGNMVIPDDYNPYDILFGKMEMKWVPNYQSFVSINKNNPVISINQLGIHKKLESYCEFIMPSNGNDRAYCYLEFPNGNYYFFGIKDDFLYTVSNNFEYNDQVNDLKNKFKTIKLEKGLKLEVVLSDVGTAQRFVSRVKEMQ